MAVIRVGVQSPAGGAGQLVDLDGPRVTVASITNASGESIQYSLDNGSTWATLASAATATSGVTVQADQVRMRKVSGGSYPAPVDVDATIIGLQDNSSSGGLTTAQAAAVGALVLGAGNASRSGPVLVAALGDSISQDAGLVNTSGPYYAPWGMLTWAMGFSLGALWMPLVVTPNVSTALLNYNRAISGENSLAALARVSELDALPVKPSFCTILIGTNDIGAASPRTAAEITATIAQICDQVRNRGITPVLCTILPRGNGTAFGGANGWSALGTTGAVQAAKALLLDVNRRLRIYAAVTPGTILADTFYSIIDYSTATSDPVSSFTGRSTNTPDYVHPNTPGAVRIGRVIWEAIAPFVAPAARQSAGSGDNWDTTINPWGSMFDASFAAAGGAAGTGVSSPTAWASITAYAVNAIVINADGVAYRCVVPGTSSSAAPSVTSGEQVDGSVVWRPLSLVAVAGVPASMTSNRLIGASATATQIVNDRLGGQRGRETSYAITAAENAQFRIYNTANGSVLPNANWTLGDAIFAEGIFEWDCGRGGYFGVPDITVRWSGSAFAGLYYMSACGGFLASFGSHLDGAGRVLLRTPILDSGLTTVLSGNNTWAIAGARSLGTGAVLTKISDVRIAKYNKTAVGALTWTPAA